MSSQTQPVCAAIRAYLAAHPGAADSVEGIRQWWLPEAQMHVSVIALRVVLDRMVRRGELRCVRLADGEDLYGAADPAQCPG